MSYGYNNNNNNNYSQGNNPSGQFGGGGGMGGGMPPILPGGTQMNRPQIDSNFMLGNNNNNNQMNNLGGSNAYQNPFTGSQQNNWNNNQNNSTAQINLPQFGASSGFNNGGNGYQQPFSQTVNNNYNAPQFPGMQHQANRQATMDPPLSSFQSNNAPPAFLQFSDLNSQQMNFIRQIESFILTHNLNFDQLLSGPPLNVPPMTQLISLITLENLGRQCRADILEPQHINDLAMKMRDPQNPRADPQVSISVLKRLLSQSGAVRLMTQPDTFRAVSQQQNHQWQSLKDLMTSLNKKSPAELFEAGQVTTEGEEQVVEKEIFVKKAQEAVMPQEEIEKLAALIKVAEGSTKVSLKRLDIELNKPAIVNPNVQQVQKQMTPEKAKDLVNDLFDQMKRFIGLNEVNMIEMFNDIDNGDGYFNRDELTNAFARCNFPIQAEFKEDFFQAIFMIYDKQRTLKFDQQQFLHDFYSRSNSRKALNTSDRFFRVYEQVRNYLKAKKLLSLSSIFLTDLYLSDKPQMKEQIKLNQDISYESQDFLHQLSKQVGAKDLDNVMFQQSFMVIFNKDGNFNKIDYLKFADFVGYEEPAKSNKEQVRKTFYKSLLKDLGSNINMVQRAFRDIDMNLSGIMHAADFSNIILAYSPLLMNEEESIRQVSHDFMVPGNLNAVNYLSFLQRLEQEIGKQNALKRLFISFNQILQFQQSTDLYGVVFAPYDNSNGDKKFSMADLKRLFMEQLSMSAEPASQDAKYFLQEYDPHKSNFVKFTDIEPDFREYIENERRQGRIRNLTGLPVILNTIKSYSDRYGQNLRQIFGKTKFNENDYINQYQFTKVITQIAQQTGKSIDDTAVQLFINMISTTVTNQVMADSPSKKDRVESSRQVSFSALQGLYNKTFKLEDNDSEAFVSFQVEKLMTHVSKIVVDQTKAPSSRFDLRVTFPYPQASTEQFLTVLKMEPFMCAKDHPQNVMEELAKKYSGGFGRVNTQTFIVEIEEKAAKIKEKDVIFNELKKHILKKNTTIETVFNQALPDVKKYRLDYLQPKEFCLVFMFLESKLVTEKQIADMLANFFQPDSTGKYSCEEFIKEFKSMHNMDPSAARRGRRLYQTRDEIIKRIAYIIEHRPLKTFGQILADQDLEGRNAIERDSFYRTIDSLKFGLGEGDIQELMRGYSRENAFIDILMFKDDLNLLIMTPDCKVELRSFLNNLVNERVVETIDGQETPKKAAMKVDPKMQAMFHHLAKEILCALYVKESECINWFSKYASFKKGSLSAKEFQSAIEALDAHLILDKVDIVIQAYYENLVSRQTSQLGYNETLLLIDQLQLLLNRDSPQSNTRIKMIEDILYEVAIHLTDNQIPLKDKIVQYDTSKSGMISRTDFTSTFFDNYLKMQQNPKKGIIGLSINQKLLLVTKYAPSPSQLIFNYMIFVDDLKRKEGESKGSIRIYMTQQDIDMDETYQEDDEFDEGDTVEIQATKNLEAPAQSNRNTYVTEKTVTKPFLKGGMQIASFIFDELMISCFQRGKSVEEFFSLFAKVNREGDYMLSKDEFSRAISQLSLEWSSNVRKVSEIFDILDFAANKGTQTKLITITDIAQAVLFNAGHSVEDLLSTILSSIHKALKEKNKLPMLRDLFNFMNSQRDETCLNAEFKKMIMDIVDPQRTGQVVKDQQFEQLTMRYKSSTSPNQAGSYRVDFAKFLKDIEYAELGISIALVWAIDLATNIMKASIINGFQSYEQLFQRYSRMEGILLFEEFRRCLVELKLNELHQDEQMLDFFNHVASGGATGANPGSFNKLSLVQLVNALKRLAPKTQGLVTQGIFERVWTETKKNNLSMTTVMTIFSDFDPQKEGFCSYNNFKNALISRLNVTILNELDYQILAKRYRKTGGAPRPIEEESILYPRFIEDYQRFEKMGMKAVFDPLKEAGSSNNTSGGINKMGGDHIINARPKPLSNDSKIIYEKTAAYCQQKNLVDGLCDNLGKMDSVSHRGTLSYQQIKDTFAQFGMKFNTKQLNDLMAPLPIDSLDNSFNYIILIELAFGRQKAQDTYNKYKLGGTAFTQSNLSGGQQNNSKSNVPQVMSQRFKDSIEVKLARLNNYVHQVSKGSYLLREREFTKVFTSVGIVVTSQDHDLLLQSFNMLKVIQTQCIDFKLFLKHYQITETTSGVIASLQKVIAEQNIRVSDEDTGSTLFPHQKDTVTLEDFQKFLAQQKIELPGFTPKEIDEAFVQMSERKGLMEKITLIRILKNERDVVAGNQEYTPYIVSEFVNHIANNNLNIFKFISPKIQVLRLDQFQALTNDKLRYKPSNPKELPVLLRFFGVSDNGQALPQNAEVKLISLSKILDQVRKLVPTYALEVAQQQQAAGVAQQNQQQQPAGNLKQNNSAAAAGTQQNTPAQMIAKQLSQFTTRVKDTLQKINDQLRRSGLTNSQFFSKVDLNGNGIIERIEFVQFFTKDLTVKNMTMEEIELVFEAVDMNKDGLISVNEFCLCLEGVHQSFEQRLKTFDPDLEKSFKEEINTLFDFFDTNKDNKITIDELKLALKSQNPFITQHEIELIMKQGDHDLNANIDRKEFLDLLLPQLKAEMLSHEQNFEDLRRLFKQFDGDQSNYLSKAEFREALIKLGIVLSDVQLDDLIKEIDLDGNQVIDIDEFIAFLSIADQIKFRNPANKTVLVKIKHARKLQPIDFYNCFKNLPKSFQPSITQEPMEKSYLHTPSWGIYPQFDSRTMNYKDLQKLDDFAKVITKKFIEQYQPQLACEITIEEATGIPLPKKDDFDWGKIKSREIRAVLVDMRTQNLLSNVFITQATWKQEYSNKWLFNTNEIQASGRQFVLRSDPIKSVSGIEQPRDVHLVFEFILHTKINDEVDGQQVCCSWGSIPASQLDKQAKIKVPLKGGSILQELKISKEQVHQEKKEFQFMKFLAASSDDPILTLSIKPFIKLTELQQLHLSMLPTNVLVNRKLLSFAAVFRLFAFRRLTKAQQQMQIPTGNFALAQFRKIFDNPEVNLILADCWEHFESTAPKGAPTIDEMLAMMEEFLVKTYAIIYWEDFHFDHVYPTRSISIESELFLQRETLLKQHLAPVKYRKLMMTQNKKPVVDNKENQSVNNNHPHHSHDHQFDDYKPFNIAEMEIPIVGIRTNEAKQDDLTKMYQQMGLLY